MNDLWMMPQNLSFDFMNNLQISRLYHLEKSLSKLVLSVSKLIFYIHLGAEDTTCSLWLIHYIYWWSYVLEGEAQLSMITVGLEFSWRLKKR